MHTPLLLQRGSLSDCRIGDLLDMRWLLWENARLVITLLPSDRRVDSAVQERRSTVLPVPWPFRCAT